MPSADRYSSDVFLSHNSADKPTVRRLAERLRKEGLRVWYDEWLIRPGDDIYLAIEQGLQESRIQVLCLSPAALGSNWVALERSTVLFRDPSNAERRFIPLLLQDCDLPDTLRRYKNVDYRGETDAAFDELLAACRGADEASDLAEPVETGERSAEPGTPVEADRDEENIGRYPVAERTFSVPGGGWANSIDVSPDGLWAAVAFDDKTVRIWELESGISRAVLTGHGARVWQALVTPDGKRIVSAADEIIIWDVAEACEIRRLTEHSSQVRAIAILDGGSRLLSGSWDLTLRVWDLESGECLRTIEVGFSNTDDPFCVSRGRSDQEGISGHRDGSIRVWDLSTGECTAEMKGHTELVNAVEMLPGGRMAVSAGNDQTIRIWDLAAGTSVGMLEGHEDSVMDLAIFTTGTMIASTGFNDGTVRLSDWQSGELLGLINRPTYWATNCVAVTPDGSHVLLGTPGHDEDCGKVYLYRVADLLRPATPQVTRRYVNAKVVLVGQSGVGKSALAHRLLEDRYVPTDSTHGLNVWRLDLPVAPDDAVEREALLWDLAGQEDYRLIHQLYLHDTALALLLINPQADDPFAEAVDWVKALRMAASAAGMSADVAKILIPARIDVGGMTVSQHKVDGFAREYGFLACLATSARRGDNCSDGESGEPSELKKLIARSIPWEELPWTATPSLLAALKNAVIALASDEDIRLIRFAELAQHLEQALPGETFGEADIRTAVTLLANHGLIRPLKFGDLVLLRPEVLIGYASAIIRAARAHKDEIGCVSEEAVFAEEFDFTGVDRLRRPDEELLMRALVQTFLDHALCIREQEGGQTLLIFPSQYRRDREIPGHPNIFVAYNFSGELQTIYTTLVVRLWHGAPFGHKELWRNAAEFTTSKGDTVGLLFERLGDGEGRLSIFFDPTVPDELKVVFVEFVHRHLHRYARDLTRQRRYVCACGKAITDLALVEQRIADGETFIRCQKCDERVLFKDHIEERFGSDSVLKKVAEFDRNATNALDNQAREQILIGHMMAICGEANQIFRELKDHEDGIDGEVEFRSNSGEASGNRIYVQLKSGPAHLRTDGEGRKVFDTQHIKHHKNWLKLPADVFLVIRDDKGVISWMNVSRQLKAQRGTLSREIIFDGEKLDFEAVWRLRDHYIPTPNAPE